MPTNICMFALNQRYIFLANRLVFTVRSHKGQRVKLQRDLKENVDDICLIKRKEGWDLANVKVKTECSVVKLGIYIFFSNF